MTRWEPCTLGKYISIKHGWPFKSDFFSEHSTGNSIVVNIGNFKYNGGFRFKESTIKEYMGEYPSEYKLSPGDILLIMTCQTDGGEILGIPGIIPDDGNTYLHNQRMGKVVVKDKHAVDQKFLYWYFLTNEFNQQLVGSASGTKILHTAPTRIEDCNILLPHLPEQKAIAAVLSSLDDKIDLLHRQNATLEAMAEALFRQWFLVEAKEEWEEKSLSSIANFLNGLPCQKYTPENNIDKLPVLKIRELNSGINDSSDWATSDVPCEYIVENGDIIFSWSASLMVKIWPGEQCVLNQHLFKVTSANYPKWFYFMWCKKHLTEFISISESHATTMGHIKRGDLDTAIVLVPTTDELSKMTKHISPIIDKHIINNQQLNTLWKLRNTLLPKLMSGEVRVSY